jgi:CheY-like chemotaxis protein
MTHPDDVEILLVEDNSYDAELTIRELRANNLANRLVWVKDGPEALDFLFGTGDPPATPRRPKVILLDLKLPKIDGLEVLRKIRAEKMTRTIPVVILTSSREERDIVRGYQLGVNSYVVKPVNFTDFSRAVSSLGLYWLIINQPVENTRAA